MTEHKATFRFYAELNDFLPPEQRQRAITYAFNSAPAVKDSIEAQGVPHVEVDLILANDQAVSFDYQVQEGDRIAVYPVFESLDVGPVQRLRRTPLRQTAFILDVHLGKLARLLRLLGFDTHRNDYEDPEIVAIAQDEHRIILTRDVGLLKHSAVTHGYWVRSPQPIEQAREVIRRFDLRGQVTTFTRCLRCNASLEDVDKAEVIDRLPPHVAEVHEDFAHCPACDQLYWRGSHYQRLRSKIKRILST
jgi:hypothetical protein